MGKLTRKPLIPDIWSITQTIARKNGWKIVPSGEAALNALGLSTQVPGRYVFLLTAKTLNIVWETEPLRFVKERLKIFKRSMTPVQW
ncbi:MAG: hypothetical protein JW913_19870 [Chitinispirillaceae bacterium]|nr:hypothetical protein [Chitinispirillaceae bacterium]